MPDIRTDVLVAAYQHITEATEDFKSLVARVEQKRVAIEGVLIITRSEDGKVAVELTGDNLGRTGARRGGGVGLAIGLLMLEEPEGSSHPSTRD
jgi:arylsulfatase